MIIEQPLRVKIAAGSGLSLLVSLAATGELEPTGETWLNPPRRARRRAAVHPRASARRARLEQGQRQVIEAQAILLEGLGATCQVT
jgi:hypothetical protein